MIEEAKKKKKKKGKREKRRDVFAAFYGVGDGRSGATFPAFRSPGSGDSSPNPAYQGEGGINSPSVPAGPNAGMGPVMASQDKEIKSRFGNLLKSTDDDLSESTHICLICSNTGKILKKDCPLCSQRWKTRRFQFDRKEPQPAIFIGDPTQMKDVDKGWDIDLGIW